MSSAPNSSPASRATTAVCDRLRTVFATIFAAIAVGLPAPGHLHVRARTTTTITLAWRDRARGERRYELRRGGRTVRRLAAGATRVRIVGLRPGRRYRLGVRPCSAARCGRTATIA